MSKPDTAECVGGGPYDGQVLAIRGVSLRIAVRRQHWPPLKEPSPHFVHVYRLDLGAYRYKGVEER